MLQLVVLHDDLKGILCKTLANYWFGMGSGKGLCMPLGWVLLRSPVGWHTQSFSCCIQAAAAHEGCKSSVEIMAIWLGNAWTFCCYSSISSGNYTPPQQVEEVPPNGRGLLEVQEDIASAGDHGVSAPGIVVL